MKYILVYISIIFFTVSIAAAQKVEVNARCQQAYTDLIALRFDDAQQLISKEKRENPDNLYVGYLENYIDFLTLFIDENESYFDQIEEREDNRLDLLDKLPDTNPYKKYLKANIRLQWAIAGLKFQNYFSSALDIRRSYLLIIENRKIFPDFKPQLISLGVLHIIIGMIPDQYQWLLSLISMEGTVPQGEEELSYFLAITQRESQLGYLKPEVLFYLGFMEMNLGLDTNRKQLLMEELSPYARHNLMLAFLNANMLARSARNDEALQLLEVATQWKGYHPFYYLDYLKGEYKLRNLNSSSADEYQSFIQHFNGINYLKDAWRKSAWSYLIKGDTATYLIMMKKVLSTGALNVGIDKDAGKEALSENIPNVILIKARLLFDGGYYDRVRALLSQSDFFGFSSIEKLERLYRLGRVEQKTNHLDMAKEYFVKTIKLGENSKRYFAGNAALQLGNIHESEEAIDSALYYYHICRNLDFDEYETSIKDKAKQGIKRIEGN